MRTHPMRTHQNTLLAMKLSTALMSLSAVVLTVMLLTGGALAKRSPGTQKPLATVQAPAPPTARAGTQGTSKMVIVYVVTATPVPQAQGSQPVTNTPATIAKPVAKRAAAVASNDLRSDDLSDLPAMPELAAIPDVPNAPAPAPRSGGGGGGGNNGGGHSAPAPAPQPKPQPPVVTKTS